MGVREPAWVVSPHLLVAQAVAAALRSVDTPAEAHAWDSAVRDRDVGEASPVEPRLVVAILEGLDTDQRVAEVARLVEAGHVRVVVVTSGDAALWWGGLLESDAVDVATVTTSVVQLAEVVERFTAGGSSMDPARRLALRSSWSEAIGRRRRLARLLATLSPQQRRVLDLLATGRGVTEVAHVMGVTRGTVRSHVKALRAKLGARSQLEAVAMLHQTRGEPAGTDLVPGPRQVIDNWYVAPRR